LEILILNYKPDMNPEMQKDVIQTACPECGAVATISDCDTAQQYSCPRCNSILYHPGEPHTYVFAAAIAALILLIPSLTMPIMTIHILGMEHSVTLFQAVWFFTMDGYLLVALIAMSAGLLIPILILGLIFFILGALKLGYTIHDVRLASRLYGKLKSWSMAEVYLISVFVAVVKLQGMATLDFNAGLFAFLFFLLTFYITIVWFNPQDLWWDHDYINR
jgi:paraquat-inducible protein A